MCSLYRWVREFLSEENRGLDVLVDYLTFRLMMLRQVQFNNQENIIPHTYLFGINVKVCYLQIQPSCSEAIIFKLQLVYAPLSDSGLAAGAQ